jgi:hypothetical protein
MVTVSQAMKITVDFAKGVIETDSEERKTTVPVYSQCRSVSGKKGF